MLCKKIPISVHLLVTSVGCVTNSTIYSCFGQMKRYNNFFKSENKSWSSKSSRLSHQLPVHLAIRSMSWQWITTMEIGQLGISFITVGHHILATRLLTKSGLAAFFENNRVMSSLGCCRIPRRYTTVTYAYPAPTRWEFQKERLVVPMSSYPDLTKAHQKNVIPTRAIWTV